MDFSKRRAALAAASAAAVWFTSAPASGLLIDKLDEPAYAIFYPYPTAFTAADRGYAFDDDPLTALAPEPYALPLGAARDPEAPPLVAPRMSFVPEMVDSGDDL